MKNKELKEALIGDKTFQEYKRRFRHWNTFAEHGISCKEFYEVKDGLDPIEWKSLEELRINEKRRKRTCRDRIIKIISSNLDRAYFLTITFNDETLANTNSQTRRVYIRRFLKRHFADFVANVDFGDLKGREHYHAVVLGCPGDAIRYNVKCHRWEQAEECWPYGFTKVEVVVADCSRKLTDYVMKLTAHAVKRSTDPLGHRLIYARAL